MNKSIISFYLDPFKEAIDFYRQLIKYGNYDPERYFKLESKPISAQEALSLSKPLYDAENLRAQKYIIDYLTKQIRSAIKKGKLSISINPMTSNKEVSDDVINHFNSLGYECKYTTYLGFSSNVDDLSVNKFVVSWDKSANKK